MNRPIVFGIILFFLALGGFLYFLKRQPPAEPAVTPAPAPRIQTPALAEKPQEEAIQRRINVKLFFSKTTSPTLAPEDRYVAYKETLRDQAFEVIGELISGSKTGLGSTLPDGTQLREIFITKDGVAYVDFSPELSGNQSGGSMGEMISIYSIVDTLTLNFPSVKKVQILVDDHAVDSLTGHVDLSQPLQQDLSIVDMNPETPATQTQTAPVVSESSGAY